MLTSHPQRIPPANCVEFQFVQWLRSDGDRVEMGEPIAEIETDKANADLFATVDGVLGHGPGIDAGVVIRVGDAFATIDSDTPLPADDLVLKKADVTLVNGRWELVGGRRATERRLQPIEGTLTLTDRRIEFEERARYVRSHFRVPLSDIGDVSTPPIEDSRRQTPSSRFSLTTLGGQTYEFGVSPNTLDDWLNAIRAARADATDEDLHGI